MIKHSLYITGIATPIGSMVACANDTGICLLEFSDQKTLETDINCLKKQLNTAATYTQNEHLLILQSQLNEYFEGKRTSFAIQMFNVGSDFQKKVWMALQSIPYGSTITYKEQAISLNSPQSLRAVAHANALNKCLIIIPCHRVIGSAGKLTGYSGNLWRKKYLLELENELLIKFTF